MKKLLLLGLLLMAACGAAIAQKSGKSFVINGELKGVKNNKKVFLCYQKGDKPVTDSATLKNGRFTISGEVNEPQQAYIYLKGDKNSPDLQAFYLEPAAKISITGNQSIKDATISGGKTQYDYVRLNKDLNALMQQREALFLAKKTVDTLKVKHIDEQLALNFAEINKVKAYFIKKNGDSHVSLDLLAQRYVGTLMRGASIDLSVFDPLYNSLSSRLRNTKVGKNLGLVIEQTRKTGIGVKAMDFTQNDTQGNPVALSQFKGKYVLIDFWASWCAPCRAENPNVVKAYERFKDKNFEIIGVSLDSKKEAWLKALAADGLEWTQVCDFSGYKNAVAVQYGVIFVPQNFLLDPNGIIVAQNLRGEALIKKLEELLGNANLSIQKN